MKKQDSKILLEWTDGSTSPPRRYRLMWGLPEEVSSTSHNRLFLEERVDEGWRRSKTREDLLRLLACLVGFEAEESVSIVSPPEPRGPGRLLPWLRARG